MKIITFLGLLIFIGFTFAGEAQQPKKPNVILIYADDLGLGLLGKYGQKHFTTPHIDSIAENGITMDRFYGSIYCAPARYTLLTGMHDGHKNSGNHTPGGFITKLDKSTKDPEEWQRKYDSYIAERKSVVQVPENEVFLPQIAQKAGLVTSQFGKLDIGFLTWHERVTRLGWDHYVGFYDHVRAHGFYPTYLWKNGEKLPLKGNTSWNAGKASESANEPLGVFGTTYSQDIFIKEIIDFIGNNKENPFFLYHSTQLPHGPTAINSLHPEVSDNDELTFSEKKYASMVKRLDDHVGLILAELKKHGLEEDTLIFFTSDNGHETYYENKNGKLPKKLSKKKEKWRTRDGDDVFDGAVGMVGLKWDLFEGGVHCPMFVQWKGKIAPNTTTDHLATHYDFMATLADLLGEPIPEGKDSLSYLPSLLGKVDAEEHDWIYMMNDLSGEGTVITKDHWKFIAKKDAPHLYNLKDNNLVGCFFMRGTPEWASLPSRSLGGSG